MTKKYAPSRPHPSKTEGPGSSSTRPDLLSRQQYLPPPLQRRDRPGMLSPKFSAPPVFLAARAEYRRTCFLTKLITGGATTEVARQVCKATLAAAGNPTVATRTRGNGIMAAAVARIAPTSLARPALDRSGEGAMMTAAATVLATVPICKA